MRGHDEQTTHMFSYLSPEQRVPADHPLRAVRALTDGPATMSFLSRIFDSGHMPRRSYTAARLDTIISGHEPNGASPGR